MHLLKIDREPGLQFTFTFTLKQSSLNALTFFSGSNTAEIDRLITSGYNADSNIHRHKNVKLVGDYNASDGEMEIQYNWLWSPCDSSILPRAYGGWKSCCTFTEFSKSENKFVTLGLFSFWINDIPRDEVSSLPIPSRPLRLQMPSYASTTVSEMLSRPDSPEIVMTPMDSEHSFFGQHNSTPVPAAPSTANDLPDGTPEDGPVFRATLSELESKTAAFRLRVKKVMKRAAELKEIYRMWKHANEKLTEAIQAIASEKASLKPVMDSYINVAFRKLSEFRDYDDKILGTEIIDPLRRIYDNDIKAAEGKKREFEDESRDYYAFLGRYLSKKNDANEKKLLEKDTKYTTKKRNFELKRFDYFCYVQDLHGGRKEQEVLRQMTIYAEKQSDSLLQTASAIKELKPSLEALSQGVENARNDYKLVRTEREERRRHIEKSALPKDDALERQVSHSAQSSYEHGNALGAAFSPKTTDFSTEKRIDEPPRKKEGILWALSKPGTHADPAVPVQKLNWHKFWVTLGSGQITEYRDWKEGVKHSGEPIDLRMATVRAARNTDRRFCFEIITPNIKRVYQTTSDEELDSWIKHIVAAIEGILDGSGSRSFDANRQQHNVEVKNSGGNAQAFFGQGRTRLSISRDMSFVDSPAEDSRRILKIIKDADPANAACADCGGQNKVEWCSINIGVVLCIECSGVHRSLGSHISKVRSLTMDTNCFNPDLIDLICRIGNGVCNSIFEATLYRYDSSMKPNDKAGHDSRVRFITAKYVDRSFVDYPSISPNDVLLGSLSTNNVAAAYGALASRADVNMVDERSGLPAAILSLLTTSPPSSPSKEVKSGEWRDESSNTFPLAELLLQNGAELTARINDPAVQSRLSVNARHYVNSKLNRGLTSPSIGKYGTLGDTLQRSPSNGNSFVNGAHKLQKRISSGSRMLKSPPANKSN